MLSSSVEEAMHKSGMSSIYKYYEESDEEEEEEDEEDDEDGVVVDTSGFDLAAYKASLPEGVLMWIDDEYKYPMSFIEQHQIDLDNLLAPPLSMKDNEEYHQKKDKRKLIPDISGFDLEAYKASLPEGVDMWVDHHPTKIIHGFDPLPSFEDAAKEKYPMTYLQKHNIDLIPLVVADKYEKRNALNAKKTEERNVDFDEEFESMQQLSINEGNVDFFTKLGSDRDRSKRKENAEHDKRIKKVSFGGGSTSTLAAPSIEDLGQFPTCAVE